LTGITVVVQPVLVSATKIAATLTPALRPHDGVIMITGIGDHLRPESPITITGMRSRWRRPKQIALILHTRSMGMLQVLLTGFKRRV
jgi:hypothetical protein